jgi:tRNA-specific 2-thiouridylase
MQKDIKKVIIGLSGGVDSSVAAKLLKDQGYDLTAVFMQNWDDTTGLIDGDCHWEDDWDFAKLVAKQLDIPISKLDLSAEYRKRIVNYMFEEYEKGRTPNPDILCNREIKFDAFIEAVKHLDADAIATGHYCGTEYDPTTNEYKLITGIDTNKDQSYFLSQLNQEQLSKALFPLVNIEKPRVRELAKEFNLPTSNKKDSQGLCFIGKVDLPTFLKQQLIPRPGKVIEIDFETGKRIHSEKDYNNLDDKCSNYEINESDGKVVGKHQGVQFYTIGQRKGLNLGGFPKPLYILSIDNKNNIIYVGQGEDHPLLHRIGLKIKIENLHWIRESNQLKVGEEKEFLVRFRHRQNLEKAKLIQKEDFLYIVFEKEQKGISPGQFAAWYEGRECCGSGEIY